MWTMPNNCSVRIRMWLFINRLNDRLPADGRLQIVIRGANHFLFSDDGALLMREIAEGRYIKRVPRVERVLFSVIADKALEYGKNYKRSWDTDAGRIKRMKEWWGHRLAESITTQEINEKLFENVAPRGLCWTETTSNEYRTLLSSIYSREINSDEPRLTVNPAAKAHRYKLNNARRRELSAEEEERLRAAVRALYPYKEPELDLALHLGCRRSNLYGIHSKGRKPMPPLDWKDVNLDWKIVRFPRAKAGLSYEIPSNDVALAALKKLRERSDGTGPVIRKPSGRELHSCRKWFEKCLERAGIANFCWHDLRHTFASRLRRAGVSIEDIADLLDHRIPGLRMVTRYAHGDAEKLRAAVATLVQTDTQSDTKTDTSPVVEFPKAKAV